MKTDNLTAKGGNLKGKVEEVSLSLLKRPRKRLQGGRAR
jgi:hypothetical protein